MTGKSTKLIKWYAPFRYIWRGNAGELELLLDDDNLRYFARIGIVESLSLLGVERHSVELTPQNGADREMIESYLDKMIPLKIKGRRSFRARRKPRRKAPAATVRTHIIPLVSIEEREKRIQAQKNVDSILEMNRLNIFSPDSNEHQCFRIKHGVRCTGILILERVDGQQETEATIDMWSCPICGDSVDYVVLRNRSPS